MEALFVLFVTLILAFLIANFLGKPRKIGFGWSFFFCIFLTPIIGLIITLLSGKDFDKN